MNFKGLLAGLAGVCAVTIATGAQAVVYDLHDYFQALADAPGPLPGQTGSELWNFRYGSSAGGLLASDGVNMYYTVGQQHGVPLAYPVLTGTQASCSPNAAFDGVFMHPGSIAPLAVVFNAPGAGVLSKVEIQYEMIVNGCASNGVTVTTSSLISNVSNAIGSFTYTNAAGPNNLVTYLPATTYAAGDQFLLLLGNNGDFNFDHANINVTLYFDLPTNGNGNGEGVPAPAPLALIGLGLLGMGALRRNLR